MAATTISRATVLTWINTAGPKETQPFVADLEALISTIPNINGEAVKEMQMMQFIARGGTGSCPIATHDILVELFHYTVWLDKIGFEFKGYQYLALIKAVGWQGIWTCADAKLA